MLTLTQTQTLCVKGPLRWHVYLVMAHSHCMGPGTVMIGLCILLCTVHTTQGQGTGMGTIEFHTHFPVPGPIPGPGPCPVQCE